MESQMDANLVSKCPKVDTHRREQGFTFIEMIVALALLSVIAAIFGMGLVAAMQSYAFSRTNVDIAQKGQMAMARMVRELMELTAIERLSAEGEDTSILYRRIQPDTDGHPVLVRLRLHFNSAENQIRLDGQPPDSQSSESASDGDLLVDGVDAFSLNYYKDQNNWEFGIDGL